MNQQTEINEEMKAWLTKIVSWKQASVLTMIDQVACKKELSHFLSSLHTFMRYSNSSEDILKTLPSVGQFLGRLVTLSVFMVENDFCQAVMKCVCMFYKNCPETDVEVKAKSWVLSQVCHCCSGIKQPEAIQRVLDVTGTSDKHLSHFNFDKAFDRAGISVCLDQNTTGLAVSKEHHKDILCLMQAYFSLGRNEAFSSLINVMLQYMIQQAGVFSQLKNDEVMVLKKISSYNTLLSYENQVKLWKKYNFTLEIYILKIVDESAARSLYFEKKLVCDIVSKGHLVQACVEHESIYSKVNNILEQLHVKSQASLLVLIKYSLHELICEYIRQSNIEVSVRKYFPQDVHPILQLLLNSPLGLSQHCCESQLKQIAALKVAIFIESKGNENLIALHHKFLPWQYTALILTLLGPAEIVGYTLEVLHMFYLWPSHSQENTKELVTSLRGLLGSTCVSKQHLQYIAANTIQCKNKPIVRYFYDQLWMVFLLFSESSIIIWRDVAEMVMGCVNESCLDDLKLMTETLELLYFVPTWTIRNIKWKSIVSMLSNIHREIHKQSDDSQMRLKDQTLLDKYINKSKLLLEHFLTVS